MSFSCTKEFSLHVDSAIPSPLLAYWKCDEANGSVILVDEVSAKPLNATITPALSQPGKIATAVAIAGNGIIQYEFYTDNSAENPIYNFSQGSFTMRCWLKTIFSATDYRIFDGGYAHPWSLWRRMWLGAPYLVFECVVVGAGYDFECWVPVTDAAWTHVVCWYEKGIGSGLRLNDAVQDLFPDTHVMISGDQTIHIGGNTDGAQILDELTLYTKKWSSAEITYDYNGGAGRTYPDVPDATP